MEESRQTLSMCNSRLQRSCCHSVIGEYSRDQHPGRVRKVDWGMALSSTTAMQAKTPANPLGSSRTGMFLWVVQNGGKLRHCTCALANSLDLDKSLGEEVWSWTRPTKVHLRQPGSVLHLGTFTLQNMLQLEDECFFPKGSGTGPYITASTTRSQEGEFILGAEGMLNLVLDILYLGLWQDN